ncbi:TPA: glyoxalase superfamily protein [Pseudomonas aeruginosa]
MNHELKIRAKRLRRAVSVVLGQDIKTSQSLELVAREENYPNWDAACACAGESARSAVDMIITDTRESHWSIEGLVKEHSQVLDLLQQITDPGSPKGALVVVGVVRRNPRNFRQPSSSPATSASRSMNLPSVWKV